MLLYPYPMWKWVSIYERSSGATAIPRTGLVSAPPYLMNHILENFYGPNAGYVQDLYERYMQDPATVSADTCAFFARWLPDTDMLAEPPEEGTVALSHGKGVSGPIETEKKEETAGLSQAQVADIVA